MARSLEVSAAEPGRDLAELSIAVVAGLGLTAAVLFLCVVPLAGHIAGGRDFISYWAAGRQLVHQANPYDRQAISQLEHAAGLDARAVLIMRNPPWALPLAYPLGFVGPRVAAVLWSLLLAGCLAVSILTVRRLHGWPRDPVRSHIHWLGAGFSPALICLTMGQTALLALLGLVLFLRLHKSQPFAAGAALWLCALKPHLFLPFGAALVAWIVLSRAWKVLAGAAAALAASSALAFAIDPQAWGNYAAMMRSPLLENEFVPCLAAALRHWLWPHAVWAQYLPAAAACVWASIYFWRRRARWDWIANGSPLMLVSLLCAPYCWLYDQCLAIPAVLDAAYATRSRLQIVVLSLMILAADFELCGVKVISPLWLWTAPAWLGWYLMAAASRDKGMEPVVKTGF